MEWGKECISVTKCKPGGKADPCLTGGHCFLFYYRLPSCCLHAGQLPQKCLKGESPHQGLVMGPTTKLLCWLLFGTIALP